MFQMGKMYLVRSPAQTSIFNLVAHQVNTTQAMPWEPNTFRGPWPFLPKREHLRNPRTFALSHPPSFGPKSGEPRFFHVSRNQRPVLTWSTQNVLQELRSRPQLFMARRLSLTNLHLPESVLSTWLMSVRSASPPPRATSSGAAAPPPPPGAPQRPPRGRPRASASEQTTSGVPSVG